MSELAVRIEKKEAMRVAGIKREQNGQDPMAIPSQWQTFSALVNSILGQINSSTTYGVTLSMSESGSLTYLTGVEVERDQTASDLSTAHLDAQTYAVYRSDQNASTIQSVFDQIFSKRLAEDGHQHNGAPVFERYTASFNPETGEGGWEIWVPIS